MIKGIKKTFELVHILNSLSIIYISRKQLYKRVQKLRQILFKRSRLITIINWDSRTIKTWNSIWIIQMHSVSRLVKHLVVFFRPRREEDHSRLNRWPQRRCHFDDHSFPGFPIPPKRCCRLRPTDLHLRNNFDILRKWFIILKVNTSTFQVSSVQDHSTATTENKSSGKNCISID